MGIFIFKVASELFKLSLSPLRCEISELGFEGADRICSSISDLAAKLIYSFRLTLESQGQALGIWIKPHTQHTALGSPYRLELLSEAI